MFKEILGDAFPIIKEFAPAIASAIGSPISGIATMFGINLLGNAFGISPAEVSKLGAAIVENPEAQTKLQQIQDSFSEWFTNHAEQFKMPSSVEVNIKMNWNNLQNQ